jgi:hypothetical protein
LRLESVDIATLLSLTVRASGPEVRAYHSWGTSDAAGFAAMGAVEILVHTYDIALPGVPRLLREQWQWYGEPR